MNKLNPNSKPKVLNIGPDNTVNAKPFAIKPTIIIKTDLNILFCWVIFLSVFKIRALAG